MSNRDIEYHMRKIYGIDVSSGMVTRLTDKILPVAKEWQNRQLEPMYPIIYLDGIVFNVNPGLPGSKKTAYTGFVTPHDRLL